MVEQALLDWYKIHKRDLPWRKNKDPYAIWISEIMLQQTRVETVIPYFYNFLNTFPTLQDLSNATQDDLYKVWQGLGYYSRVRNMQIAARQIIEKYDGNFPDNYKELLTLKGIGTYTSRAISSIAFNEHVGAIDGNAYRIITRLNMIDLDIKLPATNKVIQEIADCYVKDINAGDFNQAIMDLGSTICLPKSPKCEICPIHEYCKAYKNNEMESYPVASKKIKIKKQYYIVGIIEHQGAYYLIKNEEGLLKNLYGNIQYETNNVEDFIYQFEKDHHFPIYDPIYLGHVKHVFTHRIWELEVYLFQTNEHNEHMYQKIENLPISTCHQKVLKLKKEYPL